jgi:hypothetical protein
MNLWQRLFGWMKNVSKAVWDFVGPLVLSIAKVEAAGYIGIVTGLVVEAETKFGAGAGQAKYDFVIAQLKARLGSQFSSTKFRVWDMLIHAAVAKLSP